MQRGDRRRPALRRQAAAAGTVIALTAAAAVVAIASRAPLSRSTPVDASSARAPVAALAVLLVGCGIVALATLVALLWPARRRDRDREPELVAEKWTVHWIWKLLVIVLPIAVGATLVAAAVLGTRTRTQFLPRREGVPTRGTPPRVPTSQHTRHTVFVVPSWWPWVVLVIIVVAIAAVLLLILRRSSSGAAGAPRDVTAVRVGADAAVRALEATTDPRGAVIAAYRAMQAAFAAAGLGRGPAEAPREYLTRVLTAGSATASEARILTGLFEEARFSSHPIPERVRDVAMTALNSLRARLGTEGAA